MILLAEIDAELDVRSFHIVIDGLTDIMQQTGSLRHTNVESELLGEESCDLCDLNGMTQCILTIGGTELHTAEELHQLRIQTVYTDLEDSGVTLLTDGFVDFLLCLLHDLFDSRRVDTSIDDQLLKGDSCDLTAHRIKSGKYNRLRRIIDDQLDAGQLLQCTDITSLTADDAALHIIIRKLHDGNGRLRHLIGCATLNRIHDIVAGTLLRLFLRLIVILANHLRIVVLRVLFEGLQKL